MFYRSLLTHVAKAHGFIEQLHEKHGKWKVKPQQQQPPPQQQAEQPEEPAFLEGAYQEVRTTFGSVPCPACPTVGAPTFTTWSKWKKHLYQVCFLI